jgi:hypothetical protein
MLVVGCCVAVQGLEAILRVRCSSGLDVEGYIGSFYKPPNSPTDLYMPAMDCDKALVAKLEIMEKLPANSEVRRRTCAQGCRVQSICERRGAYSTGGHKHMELTLCSHICVSLPIAVSLLASGVEFRSSCRICHVPD